ncbi:uncharacterized protein LOC143463502 [Clavelina lepadiformis]|uniref:uncharacterized protein LOC143463502 n=1 Tax=Clavelina lepadiformis TaxID=159417 RepID=UPI0040419F1C
MCCQAPGNFSCMEPSFGCGNPPLLVNGGFSADVGVVTQPNEPFPLDTQIEYFCIDGFKLDDPDGFTSTCLQDNRWSLIQSSPEFPRCQSDDCGSLPEAKNSVIIATSTTEGSVANYVCDPGYFTNDVTETTCRRSGYFTLFWDLEVIPICSLAVTGCGNPPRLKGGVAVGKRGTYIEGDIAWYMCPGEQTFDPMVEVGKTTCLDNNLWSVIETGPCADHYDPGLTVSARFVFFGPREDLSYFPNHVAHTNEIVENGLEFPTVENVLMFPVAINTAPPTKLSTVNASSAQLTRAKITEAQVASAEESGLDVSGTPLIGAKISSVCGFPGICVGTIRDIYINCFNQTLLSCQQCGVGRAIVFLILMVIFGLMIFVGNALVICVGYRRWKRRNATKLDICKTSLAAADTLTGVQILVVLVYNFSWSMNLTPIELDQQQLLLQGSAQAYVGGILLLFSLTSSLYHLLYMGGERIYAITKPLQYKWQSNTSLYAGLVLVWIVSIITATIFAWFPGKFIFTYMTTTFLFYPALHEDPQHHDYTVAIALMALFYILPFLCLSASCVFAGVFIFHSWRNEPLVGKENSKISDSKRKQRVSILKTISLMQIGFTITLFPIVVVAGLFYSGHLDCNSIGQPNMAAFYVSMSNSLVNFVIYSAREKNFRQDSIDIFRPRSITQ